MLVERVTNVLATGEATVDELVEAEQEFQLLYREHAYTNKERGSQANWGAEGKQRLKNLQEKYRDVHKAAREGLRTDALLSLVPEVERFIDS